MGSAYQMLTESERTRQALEELYAHYAKGAPKTRTAKAIEKKIIEAGFTLAPKERQSG